LCACVLTSTAGGMRSGRERKAHTPFGGADEALGKGQTLGVGKGLPFGVRKGLTFEVRSRRSQPTVFVNARYVTPALTAVRNRRRVNLVPIAETLHYKECLFNNLVFLVQLDAIEPLGDESLIPDLPGDKYAEKGSRFT
jgi:hypothetical protein